MEELQEFGASARWKVLGGVRDDVGVLPLTIHIWEMETNCDATWIGICVVIGDLWESS